MSGLQIIWYVLIGVLLAGYMILDGADLGVGFWYLFAKKQDKPKLLASILPYWDGAEVWLLTAGGALFAAFPHAYATIFSGLYLALMLVLFALIMRAVAVEFRGQETSRRWQRFWDAAFAFGSIIPALLFGVAMGNLLRGIPMDESGNFTGTFFALLNPYSLLIGLAGLALFINHGAIWIQLKTGGELSRRAGKWTTLSWCIACGFYSAAAVITLRQHSLEVPGVMLLLPILGIGGVAFSGILSLSKCLQPAFISSSIGMIGTISTCALMLFPRLVPALGNPELSLTAANASSSPLTLRTMLILALIGMPIVLIYTVWVRRQFSGMVGDEHY